MTLHLGNVPAGITLYIPFTTYDKTNGASVTMTGLAVTDIEIYKNGSTTQRASDAGYTLLDTDGIDFDGITGLHGFSVDLNDNTDAGFYAVGSFYWIVVSAITIDSQTVTFVPATFRIVAAENTAGYPIADAAKLGGTTQTGRDIGASVLLSSGSGAGQLDFTSGVVKANLAQILGTALTETEGLLAAAFKKFFNVATPTGTVNSLPDAVPGAAGGVFIAGTNAATTVTTALTTTFTGNLTGSVASVTGAVGSVTGAVGSVTAETTANVTKISGDATAADRLEAILDASLSGAVVDDNDPDPSTTAFETDLSEATNDHINGAFCVFTSGALLGQSRKISDYDGTSKVLTVATAYTDAPAAADTFIIIGRSE